MNIIIRLSSFILLCIGVQIVWNGASARLSKIFISQRQAPQTNGSA